MDLFYDKPSLAIHRRCTANLFKRSFSIFYFPFSSEQLKGKAYSLRSSLRNLIRFSASSISVFLFFFYFYFYLQEPSRENASGRRGRWSVFYNVSTHIYNLRKYT